MTHGDKSSVGLLSMSVGAYARAVETAPSVVQSPSKSVATRRV
ncbi:hypothetical protein [Streptomyces sp. NPDC002580]